MKTIISILSCLILLPHLLSAQEKSPAAAACYSGLYPGTGNFYAEDHKGGLAYFAGGTIGAGLLITGLIIDNLPPKYGRRPAFNDGSYGDRARLNRNPGFYYYSGAAISVIARIGSCISASRAATRWNAAHKKAALEFSGTALSLRFNF